MRRLDELLMAASDRGERRGAGVLIQRLERRLQGEREQVVAAPSRRTVMATTIERPTTTDSPPPPRKRWALALAAFAVAVAAVAIAVVTLGGSGEEEITGASAIEKIEDFAANIRNGDIDALIAAAPLGQTDEPFVQWMVGLRAEPQFTNCRVTAESINGTSLSCDVTYRTGSFFSELFGEGPFPFSAQVTAEGLVSVTGWPPPPGLSVTSAELRTFFEARHPDLVDTVFGTGYAGLAWSRAAGEALDQHLDEFIAWQTAPPEAEALTREAVMERLVAAVTEIDPARFSDLTYQSFELDLEGRDFLDWNLALQADPAFSGCEETLIGFRCRAAMGEEWFFSTLAGENIVLNVTGRIEEGNVLNVAGWPPSMEVTGGERAFRTWIRETHPELEDRMFGEVMGMFKFTTEAGQLHMEYLEEYLAYLAGS